MKIAIIASHDGEKALYLHDFFKEGNRIAVDCLLTDNPESQIAERMRREGIDVIYMSAGSQMEELANLLKQRDVELLVVDDFNGDLPTELKDAFGEAVVYPKGKESAPLEVIETTNRLKAAAQAAAQPEPKPEPREGEKEEAKAAPSLEEEWAEALEMDIESSKEENPEPEPPAYQDNPPSYGQPEAPEQQPPYGNYGPQQPPYGNYGPQQSPYGGYGPQQPPYGNYGRQPSAPTPEPMPNTYLIWAVITTIVCCLIPGIIAIIYSASVSSKYYAGDVEGSRRASRNAQIWCIVAIVAGVFWATLYLPLALFLS